MARIVAIHQPNFFPWLGYFDKIRQANVFIFLDSVDYPRSGSGGMGSWVNRVRINIQGTEQWIGCPIKRLPLGHPISAATIDDGQPWRIKLSRTLQANYGRARNYEQTMEILQPLLASRETNLASFNIAAIRRIADYLGISAEFHWQSELQSMGESTMRLISLTKAVGGDTYLAGGGATAYQNDDLFNTNAIRLQYQKFSAVAYGPQNRFIPGLSILDYLMHDGRPLQELLGK